MAEDKVQISFDEDCRIRVLDPEVFKHSEELEEDCKGFVSKIQVCCVRQLRLF
jgi:Intraflagellar transport complex B, subunit 20